MKWITCLLIACVITCPVIADPESDAAVALSLAMELKADVDQLRRDVAELKTRRPCECQANRPAPASATSYTYKQVGNKVYRCGPNGCEVYGTVVAPVTRYAPTPYYAPQPFQSVPMRSYGNCPNGQCPIGR